jgi:hypothetical protein
MRRAVPLLAVLLLASCGGARKPATSSLPPQPPPPPVVEVPNPNFELVVTEVIPNADDEGVSYTAVYVDGAEAGKTAVGPRSQEKILRLRLPAGNRPVRLEHWLLPPIGEWTRLPDRRQPRERFVRIEDDGLVRLSLRYPVYGAPALQIAREAAPK